MTARGSTGMIRQLAAVTLRPLCVVLLVLVSGGAWNAIEPVPPSQSLENVIVEAQIARAQAGRAVDLLIVGDSSALMGIDAPVLGAKLGGARVESLALFGSVGPAGYAALLDVRRFKRRTATLMPTHRATRALARLQR
jgi:hypothetical protein